MLVRRPQLGNHEEPCMVMHILVAVYVFFRACILISPGSRTCAVNYLFE